MSKKFFIASTIFFIQVLVHAQIIPGQVREQVESLSGPLLWESAPSYPGKGLHLALYKGSKETQNNPVLIVYVKRNVLYPIFFVSEYGFLRAIHKLQADITMTQVNPSPYTLTFLSEGTRNGFLFSDTMPKGKELFQETISMHNILRFVPKPKSYAIIHVDYDVIKSLGYGIVFTK